MIYVDDYRGKFGRMIMCHMVSDESVEELHAFAQQLGLKKAWFQYAPGKLPHYDVSLGKRKLALEMGAKELPIRERQAWCDVMDKARKLPVT